MEHSIEVVSPVERKISVTVPAAGVNAIIDAAIRQYGAGLSLDGFRKGKVPARVIEKRFPEEIAARASDTLVNMQVQTILEKEDLNPITRIQFDGGQVERDKDFSFSFSFEVLPEIKLPEDLSALSVEVEGPELKPEDVENITTRIRKTMATLEEVTENRLPQDGDVVLVDVDGTTEGHQVAGMKADNFLMQLQPPKQDEKEGEVDRLIRTLHAGEAGESSMICPDDHPDPTLRGKTVDLKVKLHKINTEKLPELDDEFAAKVGMEDANKLRKAIFEQAMSNRLKEVRSKGQQKLLDSLLDAQDFPLPESMVNTHLSEYLSEARNYLARQGMSQEAIAESLKNMRDEGLVQARMQAKAQAFLTALAFRESIKVSEQEADRQIQQMAQESRQDYAKLRDAIWQNGMINDIQERLMAGKAMDLLYTKARKIVIGPDGKPLPAPEIANGELAEKVAQAMVEGVASSREVAESSEATGSKDQE